MALLLLGASLPVLRAVFGLDWSFGSSQGALTAPLSVLLAAMIAVLALGASNLKLQRRSEALQLRYPRLQQRYKDLQRRFAEVSQTQALDNHALLHDPMTGAANRRHFGSVLDKLSHDGSATHSLLMIDLDRFKPVNDLYGHAAGDALLTEVAVGLDRIVGKDDLVARLGGDEFAVLLHARSGAAAEEVALAILEFISRYRLNWQGNRVGVGTSIGMVAIDRPDRPPNEWLTVADEALYAAKEAGRGAVFAGNLTDDTSGSTNVRRVDAGHGEPVASASSHKPHDGRSPQIYGQLMQQLTTGTTSTSSNRQGSRREREVSEWVMVDARTEGDDASPGMTMRELLDDAASRADGGADLVRWMFKVTVDSLFYLEPARANKIGFVLPIPARAIVAVPELASELLAINAMKARSAQNLCFVLNGVAPVADHPHLLAFHERVSANGIGVALEIRANTLDVLAPLFDVAYDSVYMSRELTLGLKPGNATHSAIKALVGVAERASKRVVAADIDASETLTQLSDLGIQSAYGCAISEAAPLQKVLGK